jgi:chromosomal replication initiation ATPase DnaA
MTGSEPGGQGPHVRDPADRHDGVARIDALIDAHGRALKELRDVRRKLEIELGLSDAQLRAGERVLEIVCQHFPINAKELKGHRRPRVISWPRMLAMYLCHKHSQLCGPEIGRLLGGKDHTSVLHAVRRLPQLIAADGQFAEQARRVETAVVEAIGEEEANFG